MLASCLTFSNPGDISAVFICTSCIIKRVEHVFIHLELFVFSLNYLFALFVHCFLCCGRSYGFVTALYILGKLAPCREVNIFSKFTIKLMVVF